MEILKYARPCSKHSLLTDSFYIYYIYSDNPIILAQAAITEHHSLGGLNNGNL